MSTTTTTRPFMIFPETNEIGITKISEPTKNFLTTTFRPNKEATNANIRPFLSFGKKPKRPSSTHISSDKKGTTTKTPSKLWSALPPHLPKSTTSSPTSKESTTHAATVSKKPPNKVKRVKMPKKKVKPFVFLGGSKQPQTDILKVKPSVTYAKKEKVKPSKTTPFSITKVVTTKTTKPPIIYFKKVAITQVPKLPVFKRVKTTRAPLKIFNVMNLTSSQNPSYNRPTDLQPVRYKVTTISTKHRKETTRKTTSKLKTTTVTSIQKELTTASTSKPEKVSTPTQKPQGNSLVTEPFFPNTSSDQMKPLTEDKSEKLKVTSGKIGDSTSDEDEIGDGTSDENEKKSFSLMVSALGVPDIWDMLLFGRYRRVQSQNIHQSGIVSMQPLQ